MFVCVFFRGLLDVALECEGHDVYLFKLAVCVGAPRGDFAQKAKSQGGIQVARAYI